MAGHWCACTLVSEAGQVGLVAPDLGARCDDGVAAGLGKRVVFVPDAAVDDDAVADFDVGDAAADGVDDAGGVAAADVVGGLVGENRCAPMASTGVPSVAQTVLYLTPAVDLSSATSDESEQPEGQVAKRGKYDEE